jgi:hypothetical protein
LQQAGKPVAIVVSKSKCQNRAAALSSATGGDVRIGYARVSTADQNMHLQQDALEKAGCERVFHDTASGAKDDRSGLSEALAYVRQGDTLVVWKLDRLGRSPNISSIQSPACIPGTSASRAYRSKSTPQPAEANSFSMSLPRLPSSNLRRAVFFNRLGEIRDRSYENQTHRASGLNVLVAAIILWNTTYLQRAVDHLRNQGQHPAPGDLVHLSPLGWEHINLTGDYHWETSQTLGPYQFRPLRTKAPDIAAAA